MIVVHVPGVMGKEYPGVRVQDRVLDKLHELDMRDSVQSNVGKAAENRFSKSEQLLCALNVRKQAITFWTSSPRFSVPGEHTGPNPDSCGGKSCARSSTAEYFIIRMCDDYQNSH
jgi:hypothetical protein